jgi:large subunit GTPase 1
LTRCVHYIVARGFFTGGQGNPDTSRASRFILKDYVNGKILYCHPPPDITADEFNKEVRDLERLRAQDKLRTKRAPTTRVPFKADTFIPTVGEQGAATALSKTRQSSRAIALDKKFFSGGGADRPAVIAGVSSRKNGEDDFSRVKLFPHQGGVGEDGNERVGTKGRAPKLVKGDADGKKHFKVKRAKQRSGRGYDE